VQEVFGTIFEQFAELILEPVEFLDYDEHIVVRIRQRGRGRSSGAVVESEIVHVLRVDEGRLLELRGFSTMDEALKTLSLRQAPRP
jgi:ketosteroid isomerase-like protein